MNRISLVSVTRIIAFAAAVAAFSATEGRAQTRSSLAGDYPAPRFPSYLRAPDTVDEVMPIARRLVRELKGLQGDGLGIAKSGDIVAVISTVDSQEIFVDALRRAYAERGVTLRDVPDFSLVGLTRADAEEVLKRTREFTGKDGAAGELRRWIENRFPDPSEPRAWLKERMPEDYAAIYPEKPKPDARLADNIKKMRRANIAGGIRKYLEEHPEVRGVFWGTGGTTGRRRSLHPLESRYLGTFVYDNPSTVMSRVSSFHGDVWRLIEEKTIEPLGYAANVPGRRSSASSTRRCRPVPTNTPIPNRRGPRRAADRLHSRKEKPPGCGPGVFASGADLDDQPTFLRKKSSERSRACLVAGSL
jgi:hypothetical protein